MFVYVSAVEKGFHGRKEEKTLLILKKEEENC